MKSLDKLTPQIYVICSASFHTGVLHGVWINALKNPEEIESEIKEMLAKSGRKYKPSIKDAKSCHIHEYKNFYNENFFDTGDFLGKNAEIKDVVKAARLIAEFGEEGAKAIQGFREIELADELMRYNYLGTYSNHKNFIKDQLEKSLKIDDACLKNNSWLSPEIITDNLMYTRIWDKISNNILAKSINNGKNISMSCKKCGSDNLVKNSIVNNKQRYRCKDCGSYNFFNQEKYMFFEINSSKSQAE